ncbi:LysE/ArgO family amino acid transporter [Pistricoccus aurantiacus]|uniref:LysE/ArgO family amino acid transporter n=1 Tax=Pistricoccus aurantiacus TaxID=1883414 RepID=UPI00363AEBC1
MTGAYMTGLGVGFSLILAIGSQNAFVLRQGLRGEHVFSVCLTCALSDAVLILLGVIGFQQVIDQAAWLEPVFLYLGAGFLLIYGARSMWSALRSSEALAPAIRKTASLAATLGICLALTWLNPHVYLDTVLLLGAVSTRFPGSELVFAAGAVTASFLFFFSLGHGATLLRPLFAQARSWRMLDVFVALVMWAIAGKLLLSA